MRFTMNEKGLTLVELLVTAVIVVLMTGVGYTFFLDTSKFQARHERQKDMQTTLQIAMEMLTHEIQQAGYGIIDPLSGVGAPFPAADAAGLIQPITPFPGNATSTDAIGVLRVGTQVGFLSQNMATGNTQIFVKVAPAIALWENNPDGLQAQIRLITIGGLYTQTLQAGTSAITPGPGGVFTFMLANASQGEAFPVDSPVEALMGAMPVYTVDTLAQETEPALLQNGVLFAPGIEDLQVVYLLDAPDVNGNLVVSNPVTPYSAIRISLMARVLDPDPEWKGVPRPKLEDHEGAGTSTDRYHRAVLTRVVELPNDGI